MKLVQSLAFTLLFTLAETLQPSDAMGGNKWISEQIDSIGYMQSIRVSEKPMMQQQSTYQNIEIHESSHYGRVLVLDGVVQVTERDGNAYNEMMAHIPTFQHENPRRVLIIGGGDGYVLSEVLKHDSVVHVDHVDLDGDVVTACKKFFPWGESWKDPRVNLHIEDGAKFVRNAKSSFYDVIIQDSSDPTAIDEDGNQIDLPSAVLYSEDHFRNLNRILRSDGVFSFQAECFQIPRDLLGIKRWREQALGTGFESVRYGTITISSYPTGQIGFLLCEKKANEKDISDRTLTRFQSMIEKDAKTKYFHPRLQESCFDLPLWVEEAIYGPRYDFVGTQ